MVDLTIRVFVSCSNFFSNLMSCLKCFIDFDTHFFLSIQFWYIHLSVSCSCYFCIMFLSCFSYFLILGLRLAKKIRTKRVILFTDSQLITRQVLGEYEVIDSLLARYHSMVGQMWKDFDSVIVRQIPWDENTWVDELSTLDLFDPRGMVGILVEYLEHPNVDIELEIPAIEPFD